MLECRGITKKFGTKTAVSDLTVTLEKGKIYGLLGENGSGKTTWMKMIAGLSKPTSGEILFEGHPLCYADKEKIAYMATEPFYYSYMNVKDVVDYFDYKFDIVTCNPPYFKYNNNSVINVNEEKAIARHEISITLEDIVSCASKILRDSGSVYLVHRPERLVEILDLFKKYHFGLRKLEFVYDNINTNSCFLLIEAKYKCKDDLKILKPLYIDKYLESVK